MSLYNHQQKILDENKQKCLLALGTGTGKSFLALKLAEGKVLVICPKQQKEEEMWEKENKKWDTKRDLTVISKETFRRDWATLPYFDTVIGDESHTLTGCTADTHQKNRQAIPKTSQIFDALYFYIQKHNPKRLYLLSATPASKPMNIWSTARLLGINWNFYDFRDKYYSSFRMNNRLIYLAKRDKITKDNMVALIKRLGHTGLISDFTDVPDQTHKTVYIDLGKEQKEALAHLSQTEADPLVRRARQRTVENGVLYGKRIEKISDTEDKMVSETKIYPSKKIDYILERAQEFKKILVFANYKAQIKEIAKALRKEGYEVSELTGETKDRKNLISDAEKSEAHIVVAQCSISAGYELPSFPCVIFSSLSWRSVDHIQAKGRVLRMNKLKKNLYIYLVVKGGPDEDCYKAIMEGNDFNEKLSIDTDTQQE